MIPMKEYQVPFFGGPLDGLHNTFSDGGVSGMPLDIGAGEHSAYGTYVAVWENDMVVRWQWTPKKAEAAAPEAETGDDEEEGKHRA